MTGLQSMAMTDAVAPRLRPGHLRPGLFAADAVSLVAVTTVAMLIRSHLPIFDHAGDVSNLVAPVMGLIVGLWLAVLAGMGAYRIQHLGAGSAEYRTVMQGSFLTAALIGIFSYLTDYPLSRGFYFVTFIVGIPALLVERFALRWILHRLRDRGFLRVRTLLAGSPAAIDDFQDILQRETWVGYEPVGALVHADHEPPVCSLPVLGTPDDVISAIRTCDAEAIIFAEGSFRRAHHFNHLARLLERERVELIVVPSLTEISSNRVEVQTVAGLPLLNIAKPQAQRAGHGVKRVLDVAFALTALLVLSPLLAGVALAIKLEDGGPVLYRQRRVGRGRRPFDCLKLRSMVVDADARQAELAASNESDGVLFKMRADPRITGVGRFIRRWSIDEVPQLWNIVRGDMSLVGPRPALEREVDRYKAHVLRRLDVRPGLTGLWQVSGRSNLSWDDAVRLDLYYVDNFSFTQDITILFRTFRAVLGREGAY